MTRTELKDNFTRVVKGENFMTPEVVRYHKAGKYIAELARGEDMDGDYIYGVTVVEYDKGQCRHDLSECFDTEAQAIAHIHALRSKA